MYFDKVLDRNTARECVKKCSCSIPVFYYLYLVFAQEKLPY